MKRSEIIFGIVRVPLDALCVFAAVVAAYRLREANIDLLPGMQVLTTQSNLPPFHYYVTQFAVPTVIGFIVIAGLLSLYSLRTTLGPWREMRRVVAAVLLWVALIMAWFFLVQRQLFFSRMVLVLASGLLLFFCLAGRSALLLIQRVLLRRGIGIRTVIVCGSRPLPDHTEAALVGDIRYRYIGHVKTREDVMEKRRRTNVDLILHTDPNPTEGQARELINYCRSRQISYAYVPPVFADVHQLAIEHLGLLPILRLEPTPLDGWGRVWKRVTDFIFGTILFVVLSPFLLIVSILILVTSGWPIFYVSTRLGQYGRERIPVLKFRTMVRDADKKKDELKHMSHRADGPLFKIKNDPRVTPLGRVLRRFSIDELPQLLNVIVGQLSLVGPRPHLPDEVARYEEHHRRVFTVRPGLTGLSQISGRSNLGFEEEVRLDMSYIEDWSLGLDLWILWRTFFVALFGRGAD